MITSLIVARDKNGAIGANNELPWHLSDDLKLFKRTTLNHSILMGRKTYESIGKALPKRQNIALTRNTSFQAENIKVVHSIEDAYKYCQHSNCEQLFIIGGGEIFKEFLPLAQLLYITEVEAEVKNADVFFPDVDLSLYHKIYHENYSKNDKNDHSFTFNLYCKK